MNAVAYTVGRDIFFGAGQYNPQSTKGRGFLAHELMHVVQQTGTLQGKLQIDTVKHNSFELEAERAEQGIENFDAKVKLITSLSQSPSDLIQRRVRPENVTCHRTGLTNPDLTGDEVVAAIQEADADAIELAQDAETQLTLHLNSTRAGEPVDPGFDTILQEELGLTLTNPAHFDLLSSKETASSVFAKRLKVVISATCAVGTL